jgi:FKBP-type peptidyl-prolyl cis-trans isomerase
MHIGRCLSVASAALALCAALTASACEDSSPTAPDQSNVAFSQTDLRVGSGTEAVAGKVLTVHYTGWLYSESAADNKGARFDTSVGGNPFQFTLGAGSVISGWDQGLVGMKVGGLRRLVIPPHLAYGSTGLGPIPPNAALVFEVELLDVR